MENVSSLMEQLNIHKLKKDIQLDIFGSSIEYATFFTFLKDRYKVPKIVRDCINYIDQSGITRVGLYRISGSLKKVKKLKNRYDKYSFQEINLFEEDVDIDNVSSLLKLYFRSLPTAMVPKDISLFLEQSIEICATIENGRKNLSNLLKYYLYLLPESTFSTLGWLIRHLKNVIRKSNVNRMPLENILIIFSPCLRISPKILLNIINCFDEIFSDAELQPQEDENKGISRRIDYLINDQAKKFLQAELSAKTESLENFRLIRDASNNKKRLIKFNLIYDHFHQEIENINQIASGQTNTENGSFDN